MVIDEHNQIVVPQWARWFSEHSEDVVSETQAERVKQIIQTPQRNRSGSFSASSAGQCPRKQVFGFHGLPQKPFSVQTKNVFSDGKWRHLRWQTMLLDAGIIHQIEGKLTWEDKMSVGSTDGVGIVPLDHPREEWRGKEFGFELKGVSHFQFDKYDGKDAKEEHLNQVHRYFLLSGFELFVILYEDKTLQSVLEWVVEPDPVRMKEQAEELDLLVSHIKADTLPPVKPACEAMMGTEFQYCPYGGKTGQCLKIDGIGEMRDYL